MKERKKGSERSCVCFLLCPLHLGSVRASLTYPYNRTQSTKGKKKETHILPSQSLTPGSRSQLSSRYLLGVLYSLSLCYFGLIYNGKEIKHEIRPKNKEEREQEPDRELGEWSEQKSKGKRKACILFVSLPFLLPLVFCFISFSYRIILLFPLLLSFF